MVDFDPADGSGQVGGGALAGAGELSLIEVMARALWDELASPMERWETLEVVSRERIARGMRAALQAMLDAGPTKRMMRAALAELSDATVDAPKSAAWDAIRAHEAMIRAELEASK